MAARDRPRMCAHRAAVGSRRRERADASSPAGPRRGARERRRRSHGARARARASASASEERPGSRGAPSPTGGDFSSRRPLSRRDAAWHLVEHSDPLSDRGLGFGSELETGDTLDRRAKAPPHVKEAIAIGNRTRVASPAAGSLLVGQRTLLPIQVAERPLPLTAGPSGRVLQITSSTGQLLPPSQRCAWPFEQTRLFSRGPHHSTAETAFSIKISCAACGGGDHPLRGGRPPSRAPVGTPEVGETDEPPKCDGLENRFGSQGPTRVQIPPPPLNCRQSAELV
jgi:hypothetical protein